MVVSDPEHLPRDPFEIKSWSFILSDMAEIETALREIIRTDGKVTVPAARIQPQDDLFKLGLSSLATVNVMLAIERRFDIEIPETFLNRETFRTIGALAAMVQGLRGAEAGR